MRVDMKNNCNLSQLDIIRALAKNKQQNEYAVNLHDFFERIKGEYYELELKFKQSHQLLEPYHDIFSKSRF